MKIEEYKAAQPADSTPYSQEQFDAIEAALASEKSAKESALSDDASDKEKIAALSSDLESKKSVIEKIEAILHPVFQEEV